MFDLILGIFLFLSPIFFLPPIGNVNALQFYQFGVMGNAGYNYLQLQFFCFGTIALFITALLSAPQRKFNNKWLVILLVIFCLNIYFHPIGIRLFAPILLGFLLVYLVVVYTKDYQKLYKFIFWASLLNTIFALLQFFHIYFIYKPTGRVDGLMCLSTHLGAYQLIVLPLCYALNPFFCIVPLIGILLSKSITAIVVAFIWCVFRFRSNLLKLGPMYWLCIFTIAGVFLLRNWGVILQKVDIRLTVWLPVLHDIYHKFLGYGIRPYVLNSSYGLYENACSIYLGLIRWLGVLVIIPILGFIKQMFEVEDLVLAASILFAFILGIEKSVMDFPRLAGTIIVLFGFLTIRKGDLC